ncbi:hypothetical protein EVG20_g1621, partial [Dentipellis fragilis]
MAHSHMAPTSFVGPRAHANCGHRAERRQRVLPHGHGADEGRPAQERARADEMGLVWIDGVPGDWITGEVKEVAELNEVVPERIAGYWYGRAGGMGRRGSLLRPGRRCFTGCTVRSALLVNSTIAQLRISASLQVEPTSYVYGLPASSTTSMADTEYDSTCKTTTGSSPASSAVEYRVSSAAPFKAENPFPAALLDGLAGYRYLVHTLHFSPDNIVLGGDSAGGHLALSLARYIALAAL